MTNIIHHENILSSLAVDAYKAGHYLQLPPNAQAARLYLAPRCALSHYSAQYIVFGVRYFIEKYLLTPITKKDIINSSKIWNHFNINNTTYPFPKDGFEHIIENYNGYFPITIHGVKEGQILDQYNIPLFTISINDPKLVWLPGFIETAFQRSIWYPSTVASISFAVRNLLYKAYKKSVDPDAYGNLDYSLHDFGARGASSGESASIGGLAHLLNFNGTDTMEAVLLGHSLYNIPVEELACSIPASEHSTVTSWGNDIHAEKKSLLNLIEVCRQSQSKVFSFVSDSYNFYEFIDQVWGDPKIISLIQNYGLTPVVRPDSGDPQDVILYALESLGKSWGYSINSKGYKVLNHIRIIQGDGMNLDKINKLINAILKNGFSIENLTFGMGGGLLQKHDRDTMSWSMKMYKIKINNTWYDVQKRPLTQDNKKAFNPTNIVDDQDWVIHYQYDPIVAQPQIYKESFQDIRLRTRKNSLSQT